MGPVFAPLPFGSSFICWTVSCTNWLFSFFGQINEPDSDIGSPVGQSLGGAGLLSFSSLVLVPWDSGGLIPKERGGDLGALHRGGASAGGVEGRRCSLRVFCPTHKRTMGSQDGLGTFRVAIKQVKRSRREPESFGDLTPRYFSCPRMVVKIGVRLWVVLALVWGHPPNLSLDLKRGEFNPFLQRCFRCRKATFGVSEGNW